MASRNRVTSENPSFAQPSRLASRGQSKRAEVSPGPLVIQRSRSAAVAHELQQVHEHVDEIEVQPQRAHDGGLAKPIAVARLRM